MTIKDHFLYNSDGTKVNYVPSPNTGGKLNPIYGVVHYDAAANETSAINWMASKESKVSAHLHISRTGKVTQQVPFNVVAWHAGKSEWQGLSGLNSYSIGIELQNTGKQTYTDVQIAKLVEVVKALNASYPIKEWVGHSDISPGRKQDPGPQFPWDSFKAGVYGNDCKDMRTTSADLNLRKGAGTNHDIITTLPKDSKVQVLNTTGDWSLVFIANTNQTGWVNNKYLI